MNEGGPGSFARLFESWVRRYVEPRSAPARSRLIEQLVSQREYSQNSETGRLFLRLRANLTPEEFAGLPQTMQEVLRGTVIAFASDEERLRHAAARREGERRREAEQSRREEERRRELRRLHEQQERERQRRIDELKKAEASRREREVVRQRRQAQFDKELGRLRQEAGRLDVHRTKLSNRIHEQLRDNFLQFDQHVAKRWLSLARSTGHHKREKQRFVSHWADERYELALDEEQAAAVGTVNGNVLVTARAGSGKTRVLTARALFLHKHCGVPAHRMMLLAFNRRAASEMEGRLRKWLGDDIPHVMTFHALAYALVHPSERLLYDDKDEGRQHLSEVTQQVIDEHVRHPRLGDSHPGFDARALSSGLESDRNWRLSSIRARVP